MSSVFIVIPTYNERGNIEALVPKIMSLGIQALKIIIVDDNSPDGTGELTEKLSQKYPLRVLRREKKEGLGTAYVYAFKKILSGGFEDWGRPYFIIQMDADLSHDPEVIPRMLSRMADCDLVLGSRYVAGGGIENWDFLRKLVSRFGNIYARFILGLPYRDLTGGFKCWKIKILESLDLDSLSSTGYNFQIETTYKTHQKGYKICEIPIIFTERKTGASKFNLAIIFESFLKVLLLRLTSFSSQK